MKNIYITALLLTSNALALGVYTTISGGEIFNPAANDMIINEGIFEYGARIDYEIQYIQPNLTLEIGRFNNSQAYSTNLGFDIFYPISKLELNIAVGIGIEYNGFVKRNFYPGGRKDEFTHRMPSTINVNIKLFNTILILVEQIFDQDIFWKARFGINILNFIKK